MVAKLFGTAHGIPDSDTFRRVFERINPKALSECLYDWLSYNRKDGNVIAVDGKTICGSGNHQHKAYHVVSAFVAENHITLGEIVTEEKSNEITAVPELLETLDIKNNTITADAMSCQKEIVKTISRKKADYVIALKGNQPKLLENSKLYFDSVRDKIPTKEFAHAVRSHWSIENQLHWCLDVIFNEDASRVRKDLAPLNLNVLRKVALSLCKNCQNPKLKKSSLQKRRFRAALDTDTFLSILLGDS